MKKLYLLLLIFLLTSCFTEPKKKQTVFNTSTVNKSTERDIKEVSKVTFVDSLKEIQTTNLKAKDTDCEITIEMLENLLQLNEADLINFLNDKSYNFETNNKYKFFSVNIYYNTKANKYLSYHTDNKKNLITSIELQTSIKSDLECILNKMEQKKYLKSKEENFNGLKYHYYYNSLKNYEISYCDKPNKFIISIDNIEIENLLKENILN